VNGLAYGGGCEIVEATHLDKDSIILLLHTPR
jgi:hypothetical protein